MITQIKLGDIAVDVVKKDIKNVHLSVHPPTGKVRISAPSRMSLDTIRVFAISKLGWIKQQQRKFREQDREASREYLDRESHYVWGKRYLLKVVKGPPQVRLSHSKMVLCLRPEASSEQKRVAVARWYRQQVRVAASEQVTKWKPIIGVEVQRVSVRQMKTKWGSCNPRTQSICLNTDLAKKSPECLEYIVVHELVHMRERNHGDRFTALMDMYLPQWRQLRALLNAAPLSHQSWDY